MTIYAYPEWKRAGGSWFEFSLSLDVFLQCLREKLPPEYAPYVVAGEDRIKIPPEPGRRRPKRGPVNTAHLYCYPLEQLERALNETPAGTGIPRAFVYIGSAKLTPELLEPMTGEVRASLVTTGLPGVEVSEPQPDGKRYVGGLVAVEKVRHEPTGRVQVHEEYSRIHRTLRSALRSAFNARKREAAKAAKAAKAADTGE